VVPAAPVVPPLPPLAPPPPSFVLPPLDEHAPMSIAATAGINDLVLSMDFLRISIEPR
jgi:hypothetical protein